MSPPVAPDELYEIDVRAVIDETPKALQLVTVQGTRHWLPRSQIVEKDGSPTIRWRMLARRVMLSGADHAAQRRAKAVEKGQETKAKNAEVRRQEAIDFQAPPSGPSDRDAPFDDRLDDLF